MMFSRDIELNLALFWRARGRFSTGQIECRMFQLLPGLSSSSSDDEEEVLLDEEESEETTVVFLDFLDFLDFFLDFLESSEDLDFLNKKETVNNVRK